MPTLPAKLGPYAVQEQLGTGGMGLVYRAWDSRLNREVAVKTLLPVLAGDPEARRRFLREARAAAAISHPNVTQIHDIGDDEGTVYFAMECLVGRSLHELLREGPMPVGEALKVVRQAACGLAAAAERGIVHRDIKPSNLFLTLDGTLKITDFGLAREIVGNDRLTQDGQMIGTPEYLSPEQASGAGLDLRSDIYSLGVTFFELVTGRPPFRASSAVAIVVQHLRAPVPPVREINPAVPLPMATLIQRMLSKSPAARHQSYAELIGQIDRVAAELVAEKTPHRGRRAASRLEPARFRRRGLASPVLGYGLFALALLIGAGLVLRHGEPGAERDARQEVPGRAASARLVPAAGSLRKRANLEIAHTAHEVTRDGRLRVFGEVRNVGNRQATAATVRIVLKGDGSAEDALEVPIFPSRLAAGERGRFEAFFESPPSQAQVLLELNWNP